MRLYDAAKELYTASTSSGDGYAFLPQLGPSSTANNDISGCWRESQQQHHSMDKLCTEAMSKKHPRSNDETPCGIADHHWIVKKRSRTLLCANATFHNSQRAPPEITTTDYRTDDPHGCHHPKVSLKYVGVSPMAEKVYQWHHCCQQHRVSSTSVAAALIFMIAPQGHIRFQAVQGCFESTRFLQVRGKDIMWMGAFPTTLEQIARCLGDAVVATNEFDAENYLSPGRFRLGYGEESSMLIS